MQLLLALCVCIAGALAQFSSPAFPINCPENYFCVQGGVAACLNFSQICNGFDDCDDRRDEDGTVDLQLNCNIADRNSSMWDCNGGVNINFAQLCDGNDDCGGGADEVDALLCLDRCLPPYKNDCGNRTCIQNALSVNCAMVSLGWNVTTLTLDEGTVFSKACVLFSGDTDLAGTVNVNVSAMPGTATGADYTVTSQTITLSTGNPEVCIDIMIDTDTAVENTETFSVVLSDPNPVLNFLTLFPTTLSVSITDNDNATFEFDPTTYNVPEGSPSDAIIRLTAGTLERSVQLLLNSADQTAVAGNDYAQVVNAAVNFSPGEVSQMFTFSASPDSAVENNETFTLTLTSGGSGATVLNNDVATVTIIEDLTDVATFGFSPNSYTVDEGASTTVRENVTVTLVSGTLERDVTVEVQSNDGTAGSPSDFDEINRISLTFSSSVSSAQLSVTINPDDAVEDSEQFTLSLSQSDVQAGIAMGQGMATVMIRDSATDMVTIGITTGDATVSEGAEFIEVCVGLTAGTLERQISFEVSLVSGTAQGGNSDYSDIGFPLSLSFDSSTASMNMCFNISITDDSTTESTESFRVTLGSTDMAANLSPQSVTLTINDNDGNTVSFNQTSYTVDEGNSVLIVISLNGSKDPALSCDVTVSTKSGTASGGVDYYNVFRTFTLTAASPSYTLNFSSIADCDIESDEQLTLCLNVSGTSLTAGPPATITIVDDDVDDCASSPCDSYATCTNGMCNGNFTCQCNMGFTGNGTSCMMLGDDPHFSIVLPSGSLLCYTVQGEHGSVFNLISNDLITMNALFVPDARRDEVTWIGSLGIVVRNSVYKDSNSTKLEFDVKRKEVIMNEKVKLSAKKVEKVILSGGKLTISEAEKRSPLTKFKYPEVLVDLKDVGLTLVIKYTNQHLDMFWSNVGMQNKNSHGLIGQFFRNGVEIDHVRKLLIMPNKEPVPVMRRPVWSFMERDVADDQLCWTAMNPGYQGKGLIDGSYEDYIVEDILCEKFDPRKLKN